jgi:hypothetical protein
LNADDARQRYHRIRARYLLALPEVDLKDAIRVRREGREMEVIADGASAAIEQRLRQLKPEEISSEALTLEEVFVATLTA